MFFNARAPQQSLDQSCPATKAGGCQPLPVEPQRYAAYRLPCLPLPLLLLRDVEGPLKRIVFELMQGFPA